MIRAGVTPALSLAQRSPMKLAIAFSCWASCLAPAPLVPAEPKDSLESLVRDFDQLFKRNVDALASVKDQATAAKAARDLRSLAKEFAAIGERAQKLAKVDRDELARVFAKRQERAESLADRCGVEQKRLHTADLMSDDLFQADFAVADAFLKARQAMMRAGAWPARR